MTCEALVALSQDGHRPDSGAAVMLSRPPVDRTADLHRRGRSCWRAKELSAVGVKFVAHDDLFVASRTYAAFSGRARRVQCSRPS